MLCPQMNHFGKHFGKHKNISPSIVITRNVVCIRVVCGLISAVMSVMCLTTCIPLITYHIVRIIA